MRRKFSKIRRQALGLKHIRVVNQHVVQVRGKGVSSETEFAELLSRNHVVSSFHPNAPCFHVGEETELTMTVVDDDEVSVRGLVDIVSRGMGVDHFLPFKVVFGDIVGRADDGPVGCCIDRLAISVPISFFHGESLYISPFSFTGQKSMRNEQRYFYLQPLERRVG